MLLEKLEQGMNFTNHEKDVARYILEHPDKAPGMSSAELAEEIGQKNRLARILAEEPIHDKSTCTDIINTLPGLYDKAVTNTRLALDKNSINRIHNVLRRAECIDIYGTGISYILAQAAAFKFATLGVESSVYESINRHYLAARKNRRTIAFSMRRLCSWRNTVPGRAGK